MVVCVCMPLVQDYITVKEKGAKFLPHTAGRYAVKRFRKAHVRSETILLYGYSPLSLSLCMLAFFNHSDELTICFFFTSPFLLLLLLLLFLCPTVPHCGAADQFFDDAWS